MSADFVRDEPEALSAGADLWIVTDLERSSWAQRIDWYLNFQILRAQTHRTPEPSTDLKQVLARWDVEAPVASVTENSPLLISSSELLPNHAVVSVPFLEGQPRRWVERVHEIWNRLDAPSLRVFLPIGLDAGSFAMHWPGGEDTLDRAVVTDPK